MYWSILPWCVKVPKTLPHTTKLAIFILTLSNEEFYYLISFTIRNNVVGSSIVGKHCCVLIAHLILPPLIPQSFNPALSVLSRMCKEPCGCSLLSGFFTGVNECVNVYVFPILVSFPRCIPPHFLCSWNTLQVHEAFRAGKSNYWRRWNEFDVAGVQFKLALMASYRYLSLMHYFCFYSTTDPDLPLMCYLRFHDYENKTNLLHYLCLFLCLNQSIYLLL